MSAAIRIRSIPKARPRRRRACLVALSLLVVIFFGGWAAIELWVIPYASKLAEEELAKIGYHVTYQEPDLSPWSGALTVKNLTLHRTYRKGEPLIFVSDLGVDIDLKSLLLKRVISGRTSIRRGNVIVFGQSRQPDFKKLAVDIEFGPGGAQIKRCSGESNLGYRLNLVGAISWSSAASQPDPPSDDAPDAAPPSGGGQPEVSYPDFPGDVGRLDELANLFFCEPQGEDLVSLELDLNWDQTKSIQKPSEGADADDPAVTLDGRILGRDVLWKSFPLEQLQASFRLEDWVVAIPEMRFTAMTGEAVASGHLNLVSDRLMVDRVVSSVSPVAVISRLAPNLAAPLGRIELDENPEISGEQIIVDFRNQRASRFSLDVDAPQGLRLRESAGGGASLEFARIRGSLEYGADDSEDLFFRDFSTKINDLEVNGHIAIANFLSQEPKPAEKHEGAPAGLAKAAGGDTPTAVEDAASQAAMPLVGFLSSLVEVESEQGAPPQLNLAIVSDWSSDPHGSPAIEIKGQFSGSDFSWHGREIESARVTFNLEDRLLEFDNIEIIGLEGALQASASYDIDGRTISIPKLTSTADINHLRNRLGIPLPGTLNSITFRAPPHLTVDDFELQLGEPPIGQGQIEFFADHGFVVGAGDGGLQVRQFDLAVSWDAPHLLTVKRARGSVEDLEFDIGGALRWQTPATDPEPKGGGETGGGSKDPPTTGETEQAGRPAADAGTGMAPSLLAALSNNLKFTPKAEPVRLDGHFEWDQSRDDPAEGSSGDLPGWSRNLTLESTISGQDFDWRGFSVESAEGNISFAQGSLQFVPLRIETSDGSLEAQGSYAVAEGRLQIEELSSTADPFLVLDRVGFPLEDIDASIDFLDSPKITGRDLQLELDHPDMISGTLEVDDAAEVAVNLPGGRQLVLQDVRGPLSFGGGEFRWDGISAGVLGGEAQIEFQISPFDESSPYTSKIRIDDVSLATLSDWFDPKSGFDEAGSFDFSFEGSGAGTLETLTGIGRAAVGAEGGSAHHFPVLRGLVGFIDSGLDKEWDFDLPFGVSEGKIVTTAGRINGHSICVHLNGSVDWVNDRVDFIAGVNLDGLIGVVTKVATPMREDFVEIIGRGTLEHVEWGTKHHLEARGPLHHPWKPKFRRSQ